MPEAEVILPEPTQNVWHRLKEKFRPKSKKAEGAASLKQPEVTWEVINRVQAEYNKRNFEDRKAEIAREGMNEFYKGDLLGMQVFEGPVEVRDYRSGSEQLIKMQVRMVVGRDMQLPSGISSQHTMYSRVNDSLFSTLYFNASSLALDGMTVVSSPEKAKGQYYEEANNAITALVNQYQKINQDGERYPLTLFFAHGHVEGGHHIMASGPAEMYPTDLVLSTLLEKYPPPEGVDKIPVLLTSCNETRKTSAIISHPRMIIGYRDGLAGILAATGSGKVSG